MTTSRDAVARTSAADLDRYSRQMRFSGIAEAGQKKLAGARVLLCGVGALGTVLANTLARAGVGFIRLVDRDFVELSNLQRQVLFDESDVAGNTPKAEAAAVKLRQINSQVTYEPVVAHIDRSNIEALASDVDLIADGSDNFEIRYLINDVAVKQGKPWVHGGCIGSHGQTITIIPGKTPCLRCVFEAAPGPGEAATCESAGVLAPIISIIANFQATEALKILSGAEDAINRELLYIDCWENTTRRVRIAPLLGKVDCPCCQHRRFDWLEGAMGVQTTSLCGRNAVQVVPPGKVKIDLARLADSLKNYGTPQLTRFLLKVEIDGFLFTIFPDARAIIQGTDDEERALALYARYVGH
ncbi:MAG: ThiF family adenylyltransferase [Planctomycetota bacterium]|nr:ThiF family adenylyltransferase [Planctomycetota bacterium]